MIALNRRTHDRQKLEAYWEAAGPTLEGYGAKPLSFYASLTSPELTGTLESVVLVEFPDVAAAKAWYESQAYKKAKQHRNGAADIELFMVDGRFAPLEERLQDVGRT
jgi:uncharacterized protein (DUF1330 family)